jgi:hypothetical protein
VKRLATPALAVALFLFGVWLNAPLFHPGELPFRGSIEGGYAGMARFVSAHPNPWGWDPLQYGGLPTQFLYLPALPYLTALAARVAPAADVAYLYRLLTAVLACLGPVAAFLFALHFTGSRKWALAAALLFLLVSPSYGLFPQVDKDRGAVPLPWRIQVLAKYGEGPHTAGLTLMPLVLLAVWKAGRSRQRSAIVVAAMALAAITLTNWVSALAMTIACLLLLAAASGEREFRAGRVFAAAGLGYVLACFWLTPSFVSTIAFNWPSDAFGYRFGTAQAELLAGLVASLAAIWYAFRRFGGSPYFCFVTLCAVAYGWLATAFYVFGLDTIPESRRYAIEFELFLALALVESFRLGMQNANQTLRLCAMGAAGVYLLSGAPVTVAYLALNNDTWMPVPVAETAEHRVAAFLAARQPQGRIFASGGLRFRLNAWYGLPQVGGGFESGLRNRMPVHLAYQIRTCKAIPPERETSDPLLMLKALGVEYLVVHGPKSKEYYRDYYRPQRMDGVLPVLYRENDDTVYALPAHGIAHLIAPEERPGGDAQNHAAALAKYVAARDDASRPALRTAWTDPSTLVVEGEVPEGRLVAVQANWDPGWKVEQDGRTLEAQPDDLGFMNVAAVPGRAVKLVLHYAGTREQRLMAALSALGWLAAAAVLLNALKSRRSLLS